MNTPAPALFIGHGSPENAVLDNAFTRHLSALGGRLRRPRAALVISAHWLTPGSRITTHPSPTQIFDFSGFPDALYRVNYQPVTSAALIDELRHSNPELRPDTSRGFDHGVWTVLKHLWPQADVPLVQLSLNTALDRAGHLALGQRLAALRRAGYMIVASGNIVHNLRQLDWQSPQGAHDWAKRFDRRIQEALEQQDIATLTAATAGMDQDARLSVPTEEHYWPLLYVAGARLPTDRLEWVHEGFEYGGISLRSLLLSG